MWKYDPMLCSCDFIQWTLCHSWAELIEIVLAMYPTHQTKYLNRIWPSQPVNLLIHLSHARSHSNLWEVQSNSVCQHINYFVFTSKFDQNTSKFISTTFLSCTSSKVHIFSVTVHYFVSQSSKYSAKQMMSK